MLAPPQLTLRPRGTRPRQFPTAIPDHPGRSTLAARAHRVGKIDRRELRAVLGEETGYAHAGEISEPALRRAAATVAAVRAGRSGEAIDQLQAYLDAHPQADDAEAVDSLLRAARQDMALRN